MYGGEYFTVLTDIEEKKKGNTVRSGQSIGSTEIGFNARR